jgi:ribosomal protein S18 acetylase RimI-like enzyme
MQADPPHAPVPFTLFRPRDAAEARRGVECLVGGPETAPRDPAQVAAAADNFLAYAASAKVDPTRQVCAADPAGRLIGMCLWVPSPGRTALLFGPNLKDHSGAADATSACTRTVLDDAAAQGVALAQAMIEPTDAAGLAAFTGAGLWSLATLQYMERRPPMMVPSVTLPPGVRLEPYAAATHEAFKQTIQQSYVDTQDCPALSGLRDMEDVIAGHKAVGTFDPQLWSLVLEYNRPLGVVLLANVETRNALELVYLGLVPAARGRGLGRVLMNRVLAISARRGFSLTSLAVDATNPAAVKLYRRCGYTRVAERVALIKKL